MKNSVNQNGIGRFLLLGVECKVWRHETTILALSFPGLLPDFISQPWRKKIWANIALLETLIACIGLVPSLSTKPSQRGSGTETNLYPEQLTFIVYANCFDKNTSVAMELS